MFYESQFKQNFVFLNDYLHKILRFLFLEEYFIKSIILVALVCF